MRVRGVKLTRKTCYGLALIAMFSILISILSAKQATILSVPTLTSTYYGTSTITKFFTLSASVPITRLSLDIITSIVTTYSTSTSYILNSQKSVVVETVYYSVNATQYYTALFSTTRNRFVTNSIVQRVKSTITLDEQGSVVPASPTVTRTIMVTTTADTTVERPPEVTPTIDWEVTWTLPESSVGFTNLVKTF